MPVNSPFSLVQINVNILWFVALLETQIRYHETFRAALDFFFVNTKTFQFIYTQREREWERKRKRKKIFVSGSFTFTSNLFIINDSFKIIVVHSAPHTKVKRNLMNSKKNRFSRIIFNNWPHLILDQFLFTKLKHPNQTCGYS